MCDRSRPAYAGVRLKACGVAFAVCLVMAAAHAGDPDLLFFDGFETRQAIIAAATVSVDEGATAPLAVHLAVAPTANLQVSASIVNALGKASVSAPLTFSPTNFSDDQFIVVSGLHDADLDDVPNFLGVPAGVLLRVTSSQGSTPPFGAPDVSVGLAVLDDDSQSIVVTLQPPPPFPNSVQELGPDGSFAVRLGAPPRAPANDVVQVSLSAAVAAPHGALVSASMPVQTLSLTFNSNNFGTDQVVRFRALADGDQNDDLGDIVLSIDESADPSPPNQNVGAAVPTRLVDRQRSVRARLTYSALRGGTQFTQRGNVRWGSTSFLYSGHDPAGAFAVVRDDRDLTSATQGPMVAMAGADASTQAIEFNDQTWGVFASDGNAIRYTEIAQNLALAGGSASFGTGAKEFWIARNAPTQTWGVLMRGTNDNLQFFRVGYNGTVAGPQQVTAADANPDFGPNVHYVGGLGGQDFVFNGVPTPYAALYTASGALGGLTCLRLASSGAPVVPGLALNFVADFHASVWTGTRIAAVHQGTGGLDLEFVDLLSSGSPCALGGHIDLLGPNTYVNTPSLAFNGVEFAIGYDVQRIEGSDAVFRTGVVLHNPTSGVTTNRLFDGPSDAPGERPSLNWAGDRWILRYAASDGTIHVIAGSLTP